MASQAIPFVTPEQYLELERKAEFRNEYIEGEIFAMSGASVNHAQILANASAILWAQLRDLRCRVMTTDLRLQIANQKVFTYPDLMVICGPVKLLDNRRDTVTDATVIMEVLSP